MGELMNGHTRVASVTNVTNQIVSMVPDFVSRCHPMGTKGTWIGFL